MGMLAHEVGISEDRYLPKPGKLWWSIVENKNGPKYLFMQIKAASRAEADDHFSFIKDKGHMKDVLTFNEEESDLITLIWNSSSINFYDLTQEMQSLGENIKEFAISDDWKSRVL
jgi:hypothetical protein